MKQRLIWPVLALAVLLSACGADGKAYTTADAQALIDADAFDGEMEQVDSYTVALLYGLEENAVIDCASYIAINSSASADEVTVLVLRDEAAAKTAEEACKKRVEGQIESYQTYGPDQVPAGGGSNLSEGEHRAAGSGESRPTTPGAQGFGAGMSGLHEKRPSGPCARTASFFGNDWTEPLYGK